MEKMLIGRAAFITPKEYAEYRGVHPSTVIRWIKNGTLVAEQPGGKKGRFAIPAEVLVQKFPAQLEQKPSTAIG